MTHTPLTYSRTWRWREHITTWLGFAFILSTGPQIQTYLFGLLNSDASSIYAAVHRQELIQFPTLGNWVKFAFEWNIVTIALIVTVAALRSSEPVAVAWTTACAVTVAWLANDLYIAFTSDSINQKWVVENIVGNAIGGVFTGALTVALFSMADFGHQHLPITISARKLFSQAIFPIAALMYCCTVYYVSGIFFDPLPARIDLVLSAPANGAMTPKQSKNNGIENENPFSFAPSSRASFNANWISPPGKITIHSLGNTEHSANVTITLVAGCTTAAGLTDLQEPAWLTFPNAQSFKLAGDSGPTDFLTIVASDAQIEASINPGKLLQFNISQNSESKNLKITQFVDDTAHLELRSSQNIKFLIGLPLIKQNKKEFGLSPRRFTIQLNEKTFTIGIAPTKDVLKEDQELSCSAIKDLPALSDHMVVETNNPIVGLLFTVSHPPHKRSMSLADAGIRVNGGGGWIELIDLQQAQLRHQRLGRLEMVQVQGNITDIIVDDLVQPTRQVETYSALGDFSAEYADQGKLRVRGLARQLWKDDARLNTTRWEKLGWEPKLFLISCLGALLSVLATVTTRRLRSNQKFGWAS